MVERRAYDHRAGDRARAKLNEFMPWIVRLEAHEDKSDIEADTGQASTGVEILHQMSHNTLTRAEEYIQ